MVTKDPHRARSRFIPAVKRIIAGIERLHERIHQRAAPPELVDALAVFDAAIPRLRELRNPLTHASDDARLDDVGWFGAHVRLLPDGSVEYLVDSRYQHHQAALCLGEAVLTHLRRGLRHPAS